MNSDPLKAHAMACEFTEAFIHSGYHDSLLQRLTALRPYSVAHVMTLPNVGPVKVSTRPKLNFGIKDSQGRFGLYDWKQTPEFYGNIDEFPPFIYELRSKIADKHPSALECNHCIIMWADQIPPHHDKQHSSESTSKGKFAAENKADIFCLSLGNPTLFMLTKPAAQYNSSKPGKISAQVKPHLLMSFQFTSGSMIRLPGPSNAAIKHATESLGSDSGIRISIVFRRADRDWIDLDHNCIYRDGKCETLPADIWQPRRQPPIPAELSAALLKEQQEEEEHQVAIDLKVVSSSQPPTLLIIDEETEALESWDFDVGSTRVVGAMRTVGGCVVDATYVSPYWAVASRRSLVDGLAKLYSTNTPASESLEVAEQPDATPVDTCPPYLDLNHFMALSFYEIFGVEPSASGNAIKKAYSSLALIYHPDKGGDANVFKYIHLAYTVLMNKASRARYDTNGKAEFISSFGADVPSSSSSSSSSDIFLYVLEPVDTSSRDLMDILSRKAAGVVQLKHGWGDEKDAVGTLRSIFKQLKARSGPDGCIPVVWHRDQLHKFIQEPGRFYSGVHLDPPNMPAEFSRRVASAMQQDTTLDNLYKCTVSVFDLLPRLGKEVFRVGLNILDPDQPKCFPRAMISRHPWSLYLKQWCEDIQQNNITYIYIYFFLVCIFDCIYSCSVTGSTERLGLVSWC
jgi:hypothetical protein